MEESNYVNKKKDKSIIFLQILCSLLIVNYHTNLLNIPYLKYIAKGGFVLNTIFIFLSGYLLTSSFSKSKYQNFFSFISRRIKRIYPSFLVVLFLIFIYDYATSKNVMFLNYLKWSSGFGYFFKNNEIFSYNHLWFISVILGCYLLFYPSYILIKKQPALSFTSIILIIVIINLGVEGDLSNMYNNASNNKLLRFFYHYLVFAIAIFWKQKNISIKKTNYFTIFQLIIFIGFYYYFVLSYNYSFIALILVPLIVFSLLPLILKISKRFENNLSPIYYLKYIPYELYLIHYPVIRILQNYLEGSLVAYLLTFIISILLAIIINKFTTKLIGAHLSKK